MRKVLQIAALFLLLVGLPAGSWYYLQKGLDYRLETMGQLKDHGDFKLFTTESSEEETKAVRLINFLSAEEAKREEQGILLSKLYEQFDKREDFQLITFWDSSSFNGLDVFKATFGLEEEPQCTFEPLGQADWARFVQTYEKEAATPGQHMALVDLEGNIRSFYAQSEQKEVRSLVEHIALLLPMKKQNKPELRREIEK